MFQHLDANKDGVIDINEYLYGIIFFHFSSGPESPLTVLFGPIIEDEV